MENLISPSPPGQLEAIIGAAAKEKAKVSPPYLELDKVWVYRKGLAVLENVSFKIKKGTLVGIIGPNGAGKTTLLKLIMGLIPLTKGSLYLNGQDLLRTPKNRSLIGYVPQRHYFDFRFPLAVKDVVMLGRLSGKKLLRRITPQDQTEVELSLQKVGIEHLADRPIGELSGGQQQLAFLARALSRRPSLLLLDEPTNGLDLVAQENFYHLILDLKAALSLTILVVSHDLAAIAAHADELMCINRTVHFHGLPGEVICSSKLDAAYCCEIDALLGRGRT